MRVGIFPGSFNPIHSGHIALALQVKEVSNLDYLYFLPERRPRYKHELEHYAHRLYMIKQAIRPYPKLKYLDLADVSFTIKQTMPKINNLFKGDDLVFIFGSDIAGTISSWPYYEALTKNTEVVIGVRQRDNLEDVRQMLETWKNPYKVNLLISPLSDVSSTKVRAALNNNHYSPGLLKSVEKYSNAKWLYVSLKDIARQT